MRPVSIKDIRPKDGSIFLDNLTVCSADRLLHTNYEGIDQRIFANPVTAISFLDHDLLNLASLVETVICHNSVYLNAEFVDRWNRNIGENTLAPLSDIVTPIIWPLDDRPRSDSIIRNNLHRALERQHISIVKLMKVVHAVSHYSYEPIPEHVERDYFMPYEEGYLYGNPRPLDIATGTSFYLLCSQVLGIPYKPSMLRAQMLSAVIEYEHKQRRFDASDVVISLLEKNRDDVLREYFGKILELNMMEINVPCILTAVLKESKSPSDIIPITLQIRESKEAESFRQWTKVFSQTIQNGELARIGELVREVKTVTEKVNKFLGLSQHDNISVGLGWGPVSIEVPFSLPRILQKPIYMKRHLWFLHNMYLKSVSVTKFTDHVKRVFMPSLPKEFQVHRISDRIWASYR